MAVKTAELLVVAEDLEAMKTLARRIVGAYERGEASKASDELELARLVENALPEPAPK